MDSDGSLPFSTTWIFDESTGANAANASTFRTRAFEPVTIGANGLLTVEGTRNIGEHP